MGEKKEKYFCIFGGGAVRGLVYIGAIRALREKNVEITGYAGASAGSIAAVLTALDFSNDEMNEILNSIDYMLFRDLNFSLKIELAFSKGEVFTDKIRKIIADKMGTEEPVTFKDFPKNLYIVTSNLTTGKSVVFSKETTPDFEVAQAVRISSGFPGLMNPVNINDEYYVDGDLGKPCALSQLSPLLNPKKEKILEFRIEGTKKQSLPTNPLSFLNNGIDFLNNISTDNAVKTFGNREKYDYIVFHVKDILLFDFNISKDQREYLVKLGYDTVTDFFDNILPNKQKKLLLQYEEMKKALEKSYYNLIQRKYNCAKEILLLYISKNYKTFELLDEKIISNLDNIIKIFTVENKKILFIFPKISNHNEVKTALCELISKVEKKINSFM